MNIQVNTDHNIEGSAELDAFISATLATAFERYSQAITRIEVHLSDENAGKTGANDKRCLLEARVANHQPIVVTHDADTIYQSIEESSDKLLRALDNMVGRLSNHKSPKDFIENQKDESEDGYENYDD